MPSASASKAQVNASGIVLPPPPGATHGMPINVKLYPLAYVAGIAARLQSAPGTVRAADLVERLARSGAPVLA